MEEFFFQEHLKGLPLFWLASVSLAFWIGQDLYHPRSGLTKWWYRKLHSFGDFSDFKCTCEDLNLVEKHGEERFLKVFLTFRFRKKTKVAIRVRATRYEFLGSRIKQKLKPYEWIQSDTTTFYKRAEHDIPIAYIPRHGNNPGVYGDKLVNGLAADGGLADGTAHYIEVEVHSGRRIQRKTVQIFMPHMNLSNVSFDQPMDVTSNRFIVFQDGELPFPDDGS